MQIFFKIIFFFCCWALLHTYVIYPLIMRWLARRNTLQQHFYQPDDENLPHVSVIMSVYNEEQVIAQKLNTLVSSKYPSSKLQFFVGSDGSTDATPMYCRETATQHRNFHFFAFEQRRGKPAVINDLTERAFALVPIGDNHVLVFTDASVMLRPDTIFRMVRHFKQKKTGVVDAHIVPEGLKNEGISRSEYQYLSAEVLLKHWESRAWGMMMGPFGGCYALRSEWFVPVPTHHLVDDFYLTFRVLERGGSAVNDLEATCTERAVHRLRDEYRRKKRIAAGSFQNLWAFRRWVLPPRTKLGFAFFSHKVLRWLGGFFILGAVASAGALAVENMLFRRIFFVLILGLIAVPLLDLLFKKLKMNYLPVRHLNYFLMMNLALIDGFFAFVRGIRSGIWQRTPRS